MASRLQIEMGMFPNTDRIFFLTGVLDREKGNGSKRSQNLVDVFRGVSFDAWLQLTMEVINPLRLEVLMSTILGFSIRFC